MTKRHHTCPFCAGDELLRRSTFKHKGQHPAPGEHEHEPVKPLSAFAAFVEATGPFFDKDAAEHSARLRREAFGHLLAVKRLPDEERPRFDEAGFVE